jgi:threonine dehydrogenase-like Zn-dependent dehydrogenase
VDEGETSKDSRNGIYPINIGELFFKALSFKGGFLSPDAYKATQLLLKKLIERHDAKPSFVFDKEFSIEQAPEAFKEFSDHRLVKAVIRFEKEWSGNEEEEKVHNGRDPLEGEPVKKRVRRS